MSREFSPEVIEALRNFDEICPMRSCVVETETEFEEAITQMKAKGLRLAAVSNAGLLDPKRRLTFLPESAFTDSASSS